MNRFLVYSIVLALVGYGVWAGMNDSQRVLSAIARIGFSGMAFLCGLSLCNYLLRYLRWFLLLRKIGDRPDFFDGMICYWAGFALTTTPGKAGEAIRCLYFRNRHGVDSAHSFAALLTDRLTDLLSAIILASGALYYFEHFRWVTWVMFILAGMVLLMVFRPAPWLRLSAVLEQRVPQMLKPFFAAAPRFFERSAALLSPSVLLAGTVLGLVSWSAEAYGFGWLAHQLGNETDMIVLMGIFCLSMLAGSFLPGGLGGTEAAMAVLLVAVGIGPAEAFVIAVLCRLATLWFAVLIGLMSMLWLEHKPFTSAAKI